MSFTNFDQLPDLTGKVALITGGNSGVGFETAKALYLKNCTVIITGRREQKLKEAIDQLYALKTNQTATIKYLLADQADLRQVHDLGKQFLALGLPLHILVLNAGALAPPGSCWTAQHTDLMLCTNHLAHFLLVDLLLDKLLEQKGSRIVHVSSLASLSVFSIDWNTIDTNCVSGMSGYARSKLFNILFSTRLAQKLEGKQVYSNASQPGATYTEALSEGKAVGESWSKYLVSYLTWPFFAPSRVGALSQIYLAAHPDVERLELRGLLVGPSLPTIGWYYPSQTQSNYISKLVTEENMTKAWDWSLKEVQRCVPGWKPHSIFKSS
ncbi:hypothetical protein EDD86DRAFT_205593 [Gorgonomyces haynaldii]|nr:hypothetical protein EDD86DRAFT_205593 [Gorgonomyces haynaldii]